MDHEELRAKLKKHFADNYQRWLFDLSMGSAAAPSVSIKSLCNLLAHGVALLAYYEPGYLVQCGEVHERLRKMSEALEAHPQGRQDIAYQSAMIAGSIIEMAVIAVQKIVQEE